MKSLLSVCVIFLSIGVNICMAGIGNMESMGQGEVRYLGFIKVYEATLFTQGAVVDNSILDKDVSKCLQLEYEVALSADDFIVGANTILSRQHSPEKLGLVQEGIDLMHKAYEDVVEGDKYLLCYDATDQTTTLALNNKELVSISSADFAAVYFGIWLGPLAPIDENLRNKLLLSSRKN